MSKLTARERGKGIGRRRRPRGASVSFVRIRTARVEMIHRVVADVSIEVGVSAGQSLRVLSRPASADAS